jgi:hypothetical protein
MSKKLLNKDDGSKIFTFPLINKNLIFNSFERAKLFCVWDLNEENDKRSDWTNCLKISWG